MIPTDVFIVNWACWAVIAAALVLGMTAGRRARWGRPAVRWLLAACLVVFTAELVNLYTQVSWGSFLFLAALPFWITAVVVRIRAWRQERGEAWPPGPGGVPPDPGRPPDWYR